MLSWTHEATKITVILNCQTRMINNYLSKELFIIEQSTMQFNLLPNTVKSRINLIDELETDFFMEKIK